MKAYTIAVTELRALQQLYKSSLYAFSQVEEFLRYKTHCKYNRPDGNIDKDLEVIQPIEYKLKSFFRNRMRQQMRELIFIRLVSVLEAYLVDTVRDIFVETKKPFRDQTAQAGFTQAELLSARSISYIFSRIINKECRRLTSGGFAEVIKYYKSRFGIALASMPPGKSVMREYHERRHLLVHRLGKPDSQYRKTYGFTSKKLSVDEDYLAQSLCDFELFIHSVDKAICANLESLSDSTHAHAHQPSMRYRILFIAEEEPAIFHDEYQFWVEDELLFFRDILKTKRYINDREWEYHLAGEEEALRTFGKYIRRAEKKGHIAATVLHTRGLQKKRLAKLDETLIASVAKQLPEQPWPSGIHKTVAEKLKVSNGKVSDAIQVLIQRGVFKHQIDGQVSDAKTQHQEGPNNSMQATPNGAPDG